jgi:Flp pilus assembly protein TadD
VPALSNVIALARATAAAAILAGVVTQTEDPAALRQAASSYAAQGDPRAADAYRRAIAAAPQDLPLRVEFVEFLWRSGETDRGNEQMEDVIRIAPSNPRLRAHYGVNLAAQGRYERAVGELEAARRAGFDNAEVLYYLGSALWEIGRLDEAVTRLREAVAKEPEKVAARHRLGRLLLLQGKPSPAVAELARAAELDPASAEIAIDFGRALEAAGDLSRAEQAYRRALEGGRSPSLAHYLLGTLLARTGRRGEAQKHLALYREAFQREQEERFRAGSRQAELNLARKLLDENRLEEALVSYSRHPNDVEALRGAARALSRLGRHAEAIRTLERALQQEPGNGALREELDGEREKATKR